MSKTPYVDAVSASLPSVLSDLILSFDVFSRDKLETLIRFCAGANCPSRIAGHADAWASGQSRLQSRLTSLDPRTGEKRSRPDEEIGEASSSTANGFNAPSKKQKLGVEDGNNDSQSLYTLHSISVNSPIRKKLDISLSIEALRFSNPTSGSLEARVPLKSITRAFLVSTLAKNKNKEQWTIVLLSADSFDKKADPTSQTQIMFSIDKDVPAGKEGLKTTPGSNGSQITHAKGDPTFPLIKEFLSYLPSHIQLVIADKKSQAFSSSSGQPYVDAYRGAKEGTLVFTDSGLLWANTKPCEFFALEDLDLDSESPGAGGVKTLSATGRTVTVYVRRRVPRDDEDEDDEEEVLECEESEFAMIDGRELENVNSWIRKYRNLFGRKKGSPVGDKKGKGKAEPVPMTIQQIGGDDSDSDDEDFEASSESDGGEPSSDDSDEDTGDAENEDEEGSEDDDEVEEVDGDKLDPAHHPLLRPGAMPKMSKAAMEAVVNMMTGDLRNADKEGGEEEEEEEEDELAME